MNVLPRPLRRLIPENQWFTQAIAVTALSLWIPMGAFAQDTTPTIRLFPTTVVEDLRQTSSVAREMETGLQEVIGRLDQQQQLYNESKCDGAEGDPGCQRLAKQLGATYLEMLGIMEERLPDMEHTVNNTRLSLEKRLRSEIGNKMTSWTLQETLLGSNPQGTRPSRRLDGAVTIILKRGRISEQQFGGCAIEGFQSANSQIVLGIFLLQPL